MSVSTCPAGQLRGAAGAAQLRALRPTAATARVWAPKKTFASANARRAAAAAAAAPSEGSKLIIPVGQYCESHYKAIRRPTR